MASRLLPSWKYAVGAEHGKTAGVALLGLWMDWAKRRTSAVMLGTLSESKSSLVGLHTELVPRMETVTEDNRPSDTRSSTVVPLNAAEVNIQRWSPALRVVMLRTSPEVNARLTKDPKVMPPGFR